MFRHSKAFASFSVDDTRKAKAFYGQVLGLDVREIPGMEGLIELRVEGGPSVMVYPKDDHRPAAFTILNFPVDDVEEAVDRLTGLGILPERYDIPDIKTDSKGIFRDKDVKMAWFKDPAGNIFSVIQGKPVSQGEDFAFAGGEKGGDRLGGP